MSVSVKDSIGQTVVAGDHIVYSSNGMKLAVVYEIHVRAFKQGDHEIVKVCPVGKEVKYGWRGNPQNLIRVEHFVKVVLPSASPVETPQ